MPMIQPEQNQSDLPHNGQARGRPRIHTDDQVLEAAMTAFSEHGFDATSVRLLNRDLGLSHGTVNQRFGTKEKLFYAAIDWAAAQTAHSLADEPQKVFTDDLELADNLIYRFLVAWNKRPQLIRFIQKEGTTQSIRVDYILNHIETPHLDAMAACLARLSEAERIKPVEIRVVLMLLTFGATAPMTMPTLASRFGNNQPVDPDELARTMTDLVLSGLTL